MVHGDPLKSDELTVAIETNKNNFNVSVRRSPTSILMEDVNMMELSFKSGQLKIKKERLPVSKLLCREEEEFYFTFIKLFDCYLTISLLNIIMLEKALHLISHQNYK